MDRRTFLIGAGSLAASALLWRPGLALADTPKPYDASMTPPVTNRDDFVKWMVANRAEDPKFLNEKWDRYEALLRNHDIWDAKDGRAFLLTPREDFVRPANLSRAYDHAFLDIGYGVTISGPHAVARMTSSLDVKPGEKVLEIGTGSGYQSAYLSHLTDKVWSIEIIKPLAERTRATYDELIGHGYNEFKAISSKNADGYYGWAENGPFDKIVVTCGIDHIPPPLLQQLTPGGIMVIPVGPPGAQRVLKVEKTVAADGTITVARSDIFNKVVPFVPFTKLEGDTIQGNHNK
ncbi:protein-L-isoaspartate O-methyltransferase family protein [Lichenibacterium dinghuense]|uniref:protein-L-isoaspartate O-methyltransferase family protein n=1 Tax=Lichenibacterium dinghuense TaxID=2895977 RepID=UPI001F3A5954|nr:protein-L-isoaspartate O-methyltransferase [Lichenibacterium sp. 6Y81]